MGKVVLNFDVVVVVVVVVDSVVISLLAHVGVHFTKKRSFGSEVRRQTGPERKEKGKIE